MELKRLLMRTVECCAEGCVCRGEEEWDGGGKFWKRVENWLINKSTKRRHGGPCWQRAIAGQARFRRK